MSWASINRTTAHLHHAADQYHMQQRELSQVTQSLGSVLAQGIQSLAVTEPTVASAFTTIDTAARAIRNELATWPSPYASGPVQYARQAVELLEGMHKLGVSGNISVAGFGQQVGDAQRLLFSASVQAQADGDLLEQAQRIGKQQFSRLTESAVTQAQNMYRSHGQLLRSANDALQRAQSYVTSSPIPHIGSGDFAQILQASNVTTSMQELIDGIVKAPTRTPLVDSADLGHLEGAIARWHEMASDNASIVRRDAAADFQRVRKIVRDLQSEFMTYAKSLAALNRYAFPKPAVAIRTSQSIPQTTRGIAS